jgi:hypothetical protein
MTTFSTPAGISTVNSFVDQILSTYDTETVLEVLGTAPDAWPAQYYNSDMRVSYTPHHEAERQAVYSDTPRNVLMKGGEGGGKSCALVIKTLGRLRRSMHGIFVSPDLPHFKRSLWPEFRRWCPWDQVIEAQQYRSAFSWEPKAPFSLAFKNGATLLCGGIDEPGAWEGPNVHFVAIDEARRKRNADALKVLTGRARLPGPNAEPSQVFIATTPKKNWLYDYFGPLKCRCSQCRKMFDHYEPTKPGVNYTNLDPDTYPICPNCGSTNYTLEDPHGKFKLQSLVITLLTIENEGNIEKGFTEDRALALTPAEERVLLWAEWEDIHAGQRFLPDILLWDSCATTLPPLGSREPMVIAMDAATGRSATYSDCFGMIGVTRDRSQPDAISVRFVRKWQAAPGRSIDFQGTQDHPGPERVLRRLCADYNVIMVTYDPDQLHDMGTRLSRERIAWMFPFTQGPKRNQADTDLLNLVIHRRVNHDGNQELREHMDNADRKLDPLGKKLRIVKREEDQKIDLAICLSMCAYQALRLNV